MSFLQARHSRPKHETKHIKSAVFILYKAGNTLECVCVGVCVRVRVCVGVRKLPVLFITVKHTSCVCVGVQKCSALRCVRKQHVAF